MKDCSMVEATDGCRDCHKLLNGCDGFWSDDEEDYEIIFEDEEE